jgi:DNA-binding NarL/FixJ family response regulator
MRERMRERGMGTLTHEMNEERRIRIVLVESRPMLCDALTALLGHEDDLLVVAAASDAHAGYETVDRLDPDVVLIDAHMPGIDGIAATRELVRRSVLRKIIVVSCTISEHIAAQAVAAGARGYVAQDDSAEELILSLHQVAQGERHLSRRLRVEAVHALLDSGSTEPIDKLSRRERDVFDMLVRGQGNAAIAGDLRISIRTVETHRAAIMRKLDLHSLADMVRFAAVNGLSVGAGRA